MWQTLQSISHFLYMLHVTRIQASIMKELQKAIETWIVFHFQNWYISHEFSSRTYVNQLTNTLQNFVHADPWYSGAERLDDWRGAREGRVGLSFSITSSGASIREERFSVEVDFLGDHSAGSSRSLVSSGGPARKRTTQTWKYASDCVVCLPLTTKGNNALLTVTDRFFKYVKLVPGTENSSAKTWAERYWETMYRFWGVPHHIVSDRDPKFTSEFWRELFAKCGVKLNFITTYHPSADGQAERFNQIVETTLRCLLIEQYEESWNNLLTDVELSLNTSANAFSEISPFEVLYGVKPKIPLLEPVTAGSNIDAKNFLEQKNRIRQDTMDSLRLAQTRMALWAQDDHDQRLAFRDQILQQASYWFDFFERDWCERTTHQCIPHFYMLLITRIQALRIRHRSLAPKN